jgi:hypothetical protein
MLSAMNTPQTAMAQIIYLGSKPLRTVHHEYVALDDALARARDGANQAHMRAHYGATAFQIMPPGVSQIAEASALEPFHA